MKLSRSILFAATALLVSHSAAAEIYKCTDEQGNTRYVDKPCAGRSVIFTPTPAPVISEDASGRMDKTKRLLRAYEAEHEEEQRAEARRALEQQQRTKKCVPMRNIMNKTSRTQAGFIARMKMASALI